MELPPEIQRMQERIKEIEKLYDIGEAEFNCLVQLSALVKMLGYSPKLRLKLLKALCAIDEAIVDELDSMEKK